MTLRDLFPQRRTRVVPYPLNTPNRTSFCVARSGIYHLFRALRFQPGETVLVPDYHSGNEVAAIRAAGASIVLYPIRRNLEPDPEALARLARQHRPRMIYAIHYLGWPQPVREMQALCRQYGSLLMEDCALSMLSEVTLSEAEPKPLGTFGDYSVFCLYKTLPVPNGGILAQNRNVLPELATLDLAPCPAVAAGGRSAELALETLRSRCNIVGKALFSIKRAVGRRLRAANVRHVPVGDIGWEQGNVNLGMSPISDRVMDGLDYEEIRRKRRDNFFSLRRKLGNRVTMLRKDLPEGACPLFFPILVRDKHATAEALQRADIGAVEFWSDPQADPAIGSDARYLRAHVLELPIHQDVTPSQIGYIAEQVLRLAPERAPC
jgi:dTDP-4-amino-4,6-dideoxygalactose transaminase